MSEESGLAGLDLSRLRADAQLLLDEAEEHRRRLKQPALRVEHLVLALIERHPALARALVPDLDLAALRQEALDHLAPSPRFGQTTAAAQKPGSAADVLRLAGQLAQAEGQSQVGVRLLANAILKSAGLTPQTAPAVQPASTPPVAQPGTATSPRNAGTTEAQSAGTHRYQPLRSPATTEALNAYGRDLTLLAAQGKLPVAVGRATEIETILEILCRRFKRNPLLVGPAGVGKTAIVEGVAQRIVRGEVPVPLLGVRIVEIKASGLVAGASVVGALEERVGKILREAAGGGVVIFLDEFHSAVGAGGQVGSGDVASLLKPALARGDLSVIAATTDYEYSRFIVGDAALERRFQPIRVQEMGREQTLEVLRGLRDQLTAGRDVEVMDEALAAMVRLAGEYMRNRYFPDKAVDLLDQAIARALARGVHTVDVPWVERVVGDLTGLPVGATGRLQIDERLAGLEAALGGRFPGLDSVTGDLARLLRLKLSGLDLHPERPNGAFLVVGPAEVEKGELAEALVEFLFGSGDRLIRLDLSGFTEPHSTARILGAPPGYVGYGDDSPFLLQVANNPTSVILVEHADRANATVIELFTQIVEEGTVVDSRGRRVFFSDATLFFTADVSASGPIGFATARPREAVEASGVDRYFPKSFLDALDAVYVLGEAQSLALAGAACSRLLGQVAARFRPHGVELIFDEDVCRLLARNSGNWRTSTAIERVVEHELLPAIAQRRGGANGPLRLRVVAREGHFGVTDEPAEAPPAGT